MQTENIQQTYEELMDLFAEIESKMFEFSVQYAELQETFDVFEEDDM